MIQNEAFQREAERTSSYILRALQQTPGVEPLAVREVAVAIEKYLQAETQGGRTLVSRETFLWMIARALAAGGVRDVASQWLARGLSFDAQLACIAADCLARDATGDAWRLLSTGVVRLEGCGFENEPMWVIDLSRVNTRGGHFFELSWIPCIRRLVRQVLVLRSHTGHCGVVGLQGVVTLARSLYSSPNERMVCAEQIVSICRDTVWHEVEKFNGVERVRVVWLDSFECCSRSCRPVARRAWRRHMRTGVTRPFYE